MASFLKRYIHRRAVAEDESETPVGVNQNLIYRGIPKLLLEFVHKIFLLFEDLQEAGDVGLLHAALTAFGLNLCQPGFGGLEAGKQRIIPGVVFILMGAAAIDVSSATYETMNYWLEPMTFDCGWRKHLAAAVKQAVSVPVLAANFIRSPEQAEAQLAEGTQDFISLARPLLADPDWPETVHTRRADEVTRCIACLWCFESMLAGGFTGEAGQCALNPRCCREDEIPETPEKDGEGRTVAVIGAGVAGLTAARVLAERGFAVTVLEKAARTGGQINLAAEPPHKEKIRWCVDDLLVKYEKLGVDIHYNTGDHPPALLQEINPCAVFLATGASEIIPDIPGARDGNVHSVEAVLGGSVDLVDRAVVVIGAGLTGLETAEYLCSKGCRVSIVEMADEAAPGAYHQHKDDILPKLHRAGAAFYLGHKLETIHSDGIAIREVKTGELKTLPADDVVLSVGLRPNNALAEELKGLCVILKHSWTSPPHAS